MTDFPTVAVMLLTCAPEEHSPRAKYAQITLASVIKNLRYSGKLHLHIADDGSHPTHLEALKRMAEKAKWTVTGTETGHAGYGANYNAATQVVHSLADIVLPLEDDWELARGLNLDPFVEALRSGIVGCVRMGYLGKTQPLFGAVVDAGGMRFLALDPKSPEPHVFAGHPRIETVEWQRRVGPWPTDVDPGTTEFMVAHRPAARDGVAWPMGMPDIFEHIGTVQARVDQLQTAG